MDNMKWTSSYLNDNEPKYIPENVLSDIAIFIEKNYPDKVDGVDYTVELDNVYYASDDHAIVGMLMRAQNHKMFSSKALVPYAYIELVINIKLLDNKQYELTWDGVFSEFQMTAYDHHKKFIFI